MTSFFNNPYADEQTVSPSVDPLYRKLLEDCNRRHVAPPPTNIVVAPMFTASGQQTVAAPVSSMPCWSAQQQNTAADGAGGVGGGGGGGGNPRRDDYAYGGRGEAGVQDTPTPANQLQVTSSAAALQVNPGTSLHYPGNDTSVHGQFDFDRIASSTGLYT